MNVWTSWTLGFQVSDELGKTGHNMVIMYHETVTGPILVIHSSACYSLGNPNRKLIYCTINLLCKQIRWIIPRSHFSTSSVVNDC